MQQILPTGPQNVMHALMVSCALAWSLHRVAAVDKTAQMNQHRKINQHIGLKGLDFYE